jgi:hypothetical protein
MNWDKLFLISWKKSILIVVSWFIAVLLHNAVDAIFHVEEAFFFLIAVIVIPLYLLVFIIYNLIRLVQKK